MLGFKVEYRNILRNAKKYSSQELQCYHCDITMQGFAVGVDSKLLKS